MGAREHRIGLGPYPEVSLIKPRELADGHRATSRNGMNPFDAERQKERDDRTWLNCWALDPATYPAGRQPGQPAPPRWQPQHPRRRRSVGTEDTGPMTPDLLAALALAVLTVHVAVIAFNVFGLIAIPISGVLDRRFMRVFWWRALHLALLAVPMLQALFGRACFLT